MTSHVIINDEAQCKRNCFIIQGHGSMDGLLKPRQIIIETP